MSQKHFEALAKAVRESAELGSLTQYQVECIACKIGSVCLDFNPRFDYQRFLLACGVK